MKIGVTAIIIGSIVIIALFSAFLFFEQQESDRSKAIECERLVEEYAGRMSGTPTPHYNKRLKKCFCEITNGVNAKIIDIYERLAVADNKGNENDEKYEKKRKELFDGK